MALKKLHTAEGQHAPANVHPAVFEGVLWWVARELWNPWIDRI